MTEGAIPINPEDLPIDNVVMDDSLVYVGELVKAVVAQKLDRNGAAYCSIQVAVTDGDYEGRTVMRNYIQLPRAITSEMTKRDRILAQDGMVAFGRFCRAFGIRGTPMPEVDHRNPDTLQAWQDWIGKFYGNTGKFTVQNQEYPEGSGRMRSGINDFVF